MLNKYFEVKENRDFVTKLISTDKRYRQINQV